MRKSFVILSLFFLSFNSQAQIKTATFENGETIDYQLHDINPDNRSKLNILVSGNIGLEYFKPDFGYFKATYGFMKTNIEGMYYLGSWTKEIEKPLELDGKSDTRRTIIWAVKENVIRKTYHGAHASFSYNYVNFKTTSKYSEIAIGYGISQTRLFTLTTYAKRKPHTHTQARSVSFYSDLLFFVKGTESTKEETTSFSNFGFRIYLDGKFGGGKKRDSWGFTYSFGCGYGPKGINPIGSLGLYFSLMH